MIFCKIFFFIYIESIHVLFKEITFHLSDIVSIYTSQNKNRIFQTAQINTYLKFNCWLLFVSFWKFWFGAQFYNCTFI